MAGGKKTSKQKPEKQPKGASKASAQSSLGSSETTPKPKSALKGHRTQKGGGGATKTKLKVKWAKEVYDPPSTSESHTIRTPSGAPKLVTFITNTVTKTTTTSVTEMAGGQKTSKQKPVKQSKGASKASAQSSLGSSETTPKPKSALKGCRTQRGGGDTETKLKVKWAEEVYDPPSTADSHTTRTPSGAPKLVTFVTNTFTQTTTVICCSQ